MTDAEIFNDYANANRALGPRFEIAKASTWFRARMRSEAEDGLPETNQLTRFFTTPETAMYYYALGISPFFRMFGDDGVPAPNADIEMYPPWRVRLLIAVATACKLISKLRDHQCAVRCQDSMRTAIVHMEVAYCEITGEPMATTGLSQAFEGPGWMHVQEKLLTHWREELCNELLPFSFISLPKGDDVRYGWREGKWTQLD